MSADTMLIAAKHTARNSVNWSSQGEDHASSARQQQGVNRPVVIFPVAHCRQYELMDDHDYRGVCLALGRVGKFIETLMDFEVSGVVYRRLLQLSAY